MQKTKLAERPSQGGDDRVAETQPNSDERGMDGTIARSPDRSEPARPEEKPATERPERQSAAADRPASRSARRRRLMRWGLFALLPVILLAGAYWYVTGGEVMSTDDAYVNADKVGLSTDKGRKDGLAKPVAARQSPGGAPYVDRLGKSLQGGRTKVPEFK